MDDDPEPVVEVTVGTLGDGEQTFTLAAGQSVSHAFDDPSYVEVRALDADDDADEIPEPADTTIEQEQTNGDRVDDRAKASCQNCGEVYADEYTRCPSCGTANPNA